MVVPTIMPANSVSDAYEISNSIRWNHPDQPALALSPSTSGNRRTFTISTWFKRSFITNNEDCILFNSNIDSSNNRFSLAFATDDVINVYNRTGGTTYSLVTNAKFRDPISWYHVVLIIDTTDGTAADRHRLYVNGTRITSLADNSTISQNAETAVNHTSSTHALGDKQWQTHHSDGYQAETHFIDGTAVEPSSFGKFNNNGVWVPKEYTGSYGTNGFFMEFKQTGTGTNASGMGADTSGNNNHYAVANLAATDITTDTPTNNFMTLNPLVKAALGGPPSEGNLIHVGRTSGYAQTVLGTLTWNGSGGKWYWEMEQGGAQAGNYGFVRTDKPDGTNGVGNIIQTTSSQPTECIAYDWAWGVNLSNGNTRHDGSNDSYGSGLGDGDHGMVAVDTVAGKAWWGKNGTWFNSGNPATGANPAFTDSDMTEGIFTIYSIVADTDGRIKRYNFGNPPTGFAIASGNADANGFGNFEYAPPSGYFALCTKNIGETG